MARVYADRAALVAYAPAGVIVPTDPEATRLLTRASEVIDQVLLSAVYATDDNGMPTDAAVIEALRNATCQQAVWWLQNPGVESGQANQYQSVSIGSVSLSKGSGSSATDPLPRVCPYLGGPLKAAGLTPGVITTWW
ncbi:hypothetical protein GCM10010174_70110 [Kutzneria viridogrisea]|uniref:Head-to-tail adaptor n=1 Tax=Kutzneria viridogrisea TaxID=47990 RepID=A0ABR6BAW1_9PSEU|nr:hypothetical protein [Kutzneria viridogrisea]